MSAANAAEMPETLGLYVHVPFCLRKCPYCDFYSCTGRTPDWSAYTEAVCRNLRQYADPSQVVDTIYFGGGTPSLLLPEQIAQICTTAAECFTLHAREVTLEVNPATADRERLCGYRAAGVNRISVGVQDLHDDVLLQLGRLHTADQAIQTVQDAAAAGFQNISCDLIVGTKGQTRERLLENLEQLARLPIVHLSAYLLKIEPGTPYAAQNMQEQIPDEDAAAELYLFLVQRLEQLGFPQYEISNFAKPGYASRHNVRYWTCQPYLGIGPAAHSCYGGRRFFVPADLDGFLQAAVQETCIEDEEPCTLAERIMLGLRLVEGIPEDWLDAAQQRQAETYQAAGFLRHVNGRYAFTPEGFLLSNTILSRLL